MASVAASRLVSVSQHREQVVRSRYKKSTSMVCPAPLAGTLGLFVIISVPPSMALRAFVVENDSRIKTE
jgi:hypothetical protein